MSEFEFQRYVTIGQYIPTGSVIHRLDPRTRILGATALLLAVTLTPGLAGLGIGLGIVGALTRIAQVPLRYVLKGLLAPIPFIAILALLQVFLTPHPDATPPLWTWGPLRISTLGLVNGARVLLRFPALILLLTTASACTSTPEMVRGLEAVLRPLSRLKLPVQDLVLMVQVALRSCRCLPVRQSVSPSHRLARRRLGHRARWAGATRSPGATPSSCRSSSSASNAPRALPWRWMPAATAASASALTVTLQFRFADHGSPGVHRSLHGDRGRSSAAVHRSSHAYQSIW